VEGRPARWINRRYLVVPINTQRGVFHPKLHLLVGPAGADVICGSNNLTAAGCTSNLELTNRVPVLVEEGRPSPATAHVARKAWHFFNCCLDYGVGEARDLAVRWLSELSEPTSGWRRNPKATQTRISISFTPWKAAGGRRSTRSQTAIHRRTPDHLAIYDPIWPFWPVSVVSGRPAKSRSMPRVGTPICPRRGCRMFARMPSYSTSNARTAACMPS
jgi:hypothetical protein